MGNNNHWKDEPRVPAGHPDGGEWTSENQGQTTKKDDNIYYSPEFYRVGASEFYSKLSSAKESLPLRVKWRVDLHDESDYNSDRCYVTNGGSCFALESSGNIISVCHRTGDPIRGHQLLARAIALGGDRLDAFGPELYEFYVRNGFEPVSWTPFNSEYAPEEWKEARSKGEDVSEEPVIFYKYTGRQTNLSYEEFLKTNPPYEGEDGYDEAMRKRDEEIKK